MNSLKINLILILIFFLGFLVRIYDLTGESIWSDEMVTMSLARLTPVEIIKERASNNHTPLYFLMAHYWAGLVGISAFSLRFLSVVFGVLGMAVLYKLGHLMFNKEVGIMSALILGLSPFHLFYAQDARMYTLMPLFTLLSIYFFIKLLERDDLKETIAYILFSSLLMYTHVYGNFIIIAQNVCIFLLYLLSSKPTKPNLIKWILAQSALLLLFLPWVNILLQQIARVKSDFWLTSPSILSMVSSIGRYAGSVPVFLSFFLLVFFAIFNIRPNLKALEESLKTRTWNSRLSQSGNKIFLLLLWLVIPVFVPFIISKLITPIYLTRYTIGASLALYLLVAKGINDINYKAVKLLIISLVIILSLANVWQYYKADNKAPWKEVAAFVDSNAQPGDLLLFNTLRQQNIFEYYSKRTDLIHKPFPNDSCCISQNNIKFIEPVVNGYARVWFIRNSPDNLSVVKEILTPRYRFSSFGPYSAKYDNSINLYFFNEKN